MFRLFSLLMFNLNGWKIEHDLIPKEGYKKFILVGGPHTSNWDAVYFVAATRKMGLKPRFLIKKEWMRFPFGMMFKPLGGLGIDRNPKDPSKKKSMVAIMVELFGDAKELIIAISPEGTRSPNSSWKKGFYHTAKEAGVPILLGHLDYKAKIAGISKAFIPTGDIEKDFKEISDYYLKFAGKNPEQYKPYSPTI